MRSGLLTRSERQSEFLWLYLCDLLSLQFLIVLADGDILVLVNDYGSVGVLNCFAVAASLLQGLQIITAGRLGLTFSEEFLQKAKWIIAALLS